MSSGPAGPGQRSSQMMRSSPRGSHPAVLSACIALTARGSGARGTRSQEIIPLPNACQAAHHDMPFVVRPVAGMVGDTGAGKRTGEQGA